jgi:hypothetical protein
MAKAPIAVVMSSTTANAVMTLLRIVKF